MKTNRAPSPAWDGPHMTGGKRRLIWSAFLIAGVVPGGLLIWLDANKALASISGLIVFTLIIMATQYLRATRERLARLDRPEIVAPWFEGEEAFRQRQEQNRLKYLARRKGGDSC